MLIFKFAMLVVFTEVIAQIQSQDVLSQTLTLIEVLLGCASLVLTAYYYYLGRIPIPHRVGDKEVDRAIRKLFVHNEPVSDAVLAQLGKSWKSLKRFIVIIS